MGENLYLVIDLKATFCGRGTVPSDQMEFIEIGAVMVDGNGLRLIDETQSFVRPSRQSVLTSFCTRLTSIAQSDVDEVRRPVRALSMVTSWGGGTWGRHHHAAGRPGSVSTRSGWMKSTPRNWRNHLGGIEEHLAELTSNREAVAECSKIDRYRREVCRVMVGGADVGLAQIQAGMAWFFRRYAKELTFGALE